MGSLDACGQRAIRRQHRCDQDEFDIERLLITKDRKQDLKPHLAYSNSWMSSSGKMLPSPFDVINGLKTLLFDQISETRSSSLSKYHIKQIKWQYAQVFAKVLDMFGFTDPNRPFNFGSKSDMDILKPSGKVVSFVWWLLTIEPSFLTAMNQAIRVNDSELLPMLGPLARVTYVILSSVRNEP